MSILERIRGNPGKWTKGEIARRADGSRTCVLDPAATCWCLIGLAMCCYPPDEVGTVLEKIANVVPGSNVSGFNDDPRTTFDDIVRVVELAGV